MINRGKESQILYISNYIMYKPNRFFTYLLQYLGFLYERITICFPIPMIWRWQWKFFKSLAVNDKTVNLRLLLEGPGDLWTLWMDEVRQVAHVTLSDSY